MNCFSIIVSFARLVDFIYALTGSGWFLLIKYSNSKISISTEGTTWRVQSKARPTRSLRTCLACLTTSGQAAVEVTGYAMLVSVLLGKEPSTSWHAGRGFVDCWHRYSWWNQCLINNVLVVARLWHRWHSQNYDTIQSLVFARFRRPFQSTSSDWLPRCHRWVIAGLTITWEQY